MLLVKYLGCHVLYVASERVRSITHKHLRPFAVTPIKSSPTCDELKHSKNMTSLDHSIHAKVPYFHMESCSVVLALRNRGTIPVAITQKSVGTLKCHDYQTLLLSAQG